jgi:phosphoribosylamine--glycine ligase
MAAGGYPGTYRRGDAIEGLSAADTRNSKVFHAGTSLKNGMVVTDGGRVLCVVGLGGDVADAQREAYAAVDDIRWTDAYYRKDIGHRAVRREEG